MLDPDFGQLSFVEVPGDLAGSYWECDWRFPPTGTDVAIRLPGDRRGPSGEARAFFTRLPLIFDLIVVGVRSKLTEVFHSFLNRSVRESLWADVRLVGISVEDPAATPVRWDMTFETIGEQWLEITIPFVGHQPQAPVVDS